MDKTNDKKSSIFGGNDKGIAISSAFALKLEEFCYKFALF